jgi:hypothetical protein
MARPRGFEPLTFAFGGQRSIQLSYGRLPIEIAETVRSGNRAGPLQKPAWAGAFLPLPVLNPRKIAVFRLRIKTNLLVLADTRMGR